MTRIATNVAATRGLRNLNKATNAQNTTLQRLSTGTKVNSGADNPAGLIAGDKLKLQLTTIEQSITNSNRASNVIATADGALGEISGLLNQVRGLVQEGLNDGALSDTEIEANQLQIDSALSAINRITSNTTFGGEKLIDGSKSFNTTQTAADAAELSDFSVNEAFLGNASSKAITAEVNSAAERGVLTRTGANAESISFEIGGNKGSQVLFFDGGSSQANIRDAINAVTDATGITASITTAETAGTGDFALNAGADTIRFTEAQAFSDTVQINFTNDTASSGTSVSVAATTGGNKVITVELADNGAAITATANDVISAINNDENASPLVSAALQAGAGTDVFAAADVAAANLDVTTGKVQGVLTLQSEDFGSAAFTDVNVLSGSFATADSDGAAVFRDAGADIVATINGSRAQGDGLKASVSTATLNASLTFTSTANTAGTTNTINVTGGGATFQIGEQVTANGQLNLAFDSVNTARLGGATGKLYELGSGAGKSLQDVGPGGASGNDLVKIVDEALEKVSTIRGRLGAAQKNIIDTNVSTLGVALENISEARSQIVDTDFASETAKLTQSQILSQAGISVLSIANNQPQQVLALLG